MRLPAGKGIAPAWIDQITPDRHGLNGPTTKLDISLFFFYLSHTVRPAHRFFTVIGRVSDPDHPAAYQ